MKSVYGTCYDPKCLRIAPDIKYIGSYNCISNYGQFDIKPRIMLRSCFWFNYLLEGYFGKR